MSSLTPLNSDSDNKILFLRVILCWMLESIILDFSCSLICILTGCTISLIMSYQNDTLISFPFQLWSTDHRSQWARFPVPFLVQLLRSPWQLGWGLFVFEQTALCSLQVALCSSFHYCVSWFWYRIFIILCMIICNCFLCLYILLDVRGVA